MDVVDQFESDQIQSQQMDESCNDESTDDEEIGENNLVPEYDFKLMSETIEQIKDCTYFQVFLI